MLSIAGKRVLLGAFDDKLEAARTYNEGARDHYGEFAALNILPEHYYL
jgi:hypothetical protein